MKSCSCCDCIKPESDFYRLRDGFEPTCKQCRNQQRIAARTAAKQLTGRYFSDNDLKLRSLFSAAMAGSGSHARYCN